MAETACENRERAQVERDVASDAPTLDIPSRGGIESEDTERARQDGVGGTLSAVDKLRRRAKNGQAPELAFAVLDVIQPDWRKDIRDVRWLATLDEIVQFREANGSLPRHGSESPEERRLYQWLALRRGEVNGFGTSARRFERKGHRSILDERLPGWLQTREEKWLVNLDDIVRFREAQGFLPRYGAGRSAEEGRLYNWLATRRKEATGAGAGAARFASERRDLTLDERLPGWRENRTGPKWHTDLDEIARFRKVNGFLPRASGKIPGERRLYGWLSHRRREARGAGKGATKFAREGRAEILDERLPGWRG